MQDTMTPETALRLVELNRLFYETFGEPFSASRRRPQPGWERLLLRVAALPDSSVLDVGCGDGRFGRFLRGRGHHGPYVGVDFSAALLMQTPDWTESQFLSRDLSAPECLAGMGQHDLVVCLSTLQHIPGQTNRLRLLADLAGCLTDGGVLVLANWQFTGSQRQQRKISPWSAVGIDECELEAGDYLLSWSRGGQGYRYVALLDEVTMLRMAAAAGLRLVEQFRSDGREGDLNLYTCLSR